MFNLTKDEAKVALFLITVTLAGVGINYLSKMNAHIEKVMISNQNIGKIDINHITLEDLLVSRVISAKLAEKLIQYRNKHGLFSSLQELKEIGGIRDSRLEKLKKIFFIDETTF